MDCTWVPQRPDSGFLLGHFPAFVTSRAGIIQREWARTYGSAVRSVGPVGIERVFLFSPAALHKILVSDWMDYPRPQFLRNVLGLSTGYGLLTVTGDEHKQMRKAMNLAFALPNLMAQTEQYYDHIEVLVNVLRNQLSKQSDESQGKVMPVYEWMSKVTLDIICDTAFGYHSNSLLNPNNELTEAYEDLIGLQDGVTLAISVLVAIPGMPSFLASELCYRFRRLFELSSFLAPVKIWVDSVHRIRRISRAMLAEKLADTAVNVDDTSTKKDVMSLLLSNEAMVDQVLTFLGAGHETTASGLSWALWLLANDAQAQTKLRDEVSRVFADTERPDYRALKDLPMLDCVMRAPPHHMESLRLMPPVPTTIRTASKSAWIDGIYVPKGTDIHLPIHAANTSTDVWGPDAEEFRPERWLALPAAYTPAFSMLSFVAGPHGCIGKTMGISEMKVVLAAVIANFEFAPAHAGLRIEC
ncbi:cytochrome P450 [Artomyces pyxidatus]|uniref:Cytochrome P450 n=1 Tax=Artomyces pyxidatus TaxID=48021 RepID=A0ACB8SKQ8_9AGAM|nr:cytochrome P450 [Artomyces pyxidatus]